MQNSRLDHESASNETRLDADARTCLNLLNANPLPPLQLCSPEEARDRHERAAASIKEPVEPVEDVEDAYRGGVPVRIYRPRDSVGLTVYVHGGGWVTGSLGSYDRICRILANRSSTTFISIGYDLAPEAKHPVQLNQILAVLRELRGSGSGPIVLAGDSAGAYLAALAALRAKVEALTLGALVLPNPVIDPALDTPSARMWAQGYRLETEAMRWYWRHFMPEGIAAPDLRNADLARFPPTLILTAGFDPLHDEGEAFARSLAAANVPIEYRNYPGQIHGFLRLSHAIWQARAAQEVVGRFIRRHAQAGQGGDTRGN